MIMEQCPEELKAIYEKAMDEYRARGAEIVSIPHIQKINSKYRVFTRYFDDVSAAAQQIARNPSLLKWIYLLSHVQQDKTKAKSLLQKLPPIPGSDPASYMSPVFALLRYIPRIVNELCRRGLPEDIISDTLSEFEDKMEDCRDRCGVLGLKPFLYWIQCFIDLEIVRVGRFNFEINRTFEPGMKVFRSISGEYKILADNVSVHSSGLLLDSAGCEDARCSFFAELQETDAYYTGHPVSADCLISRGTVSLEKKLWYVALSEGDKVLCVHIPARKSLSKEICYASYARANEIFSKHWREYEYKAIMCISWMLDSQLKSLIGRRSNLTDFIDGYISYPRKSKGKDIYSFVFFNKEGTDIKLLPEDTHLRRAVKAHLLKGGYIYEHGGLIFGE